MDMVAEDEAKENVAVEAAADGADTSTDKLHDAVLASPQPALDHSTVNDERILRSDLVFFLIYLGLPSSWISELFFNLGSGKCKKTKVAESFPSCKT